LLTKFYFFINNKIFDLDENATDLDFEESLDKNHSTLSSNKNQLAFGDHAAMAIDFKGEGLIYFFRNFLLFQY